MKALRRTPLPEIEFADFGFIFSRPDQFEDYKNNRDDYESFFSEWDQCYYLLERKHRTWFYSSVGKEGVIFHHWHTMVCGDVEDQHAMLLTNEYAEKKMIEKLALFRDFYSYQEGLPELFNKVAGIMDNLRYGEML
jgi:hypothetical protein